MHEEGVEYLDVIEQYKQYVLPDSPFVPLEYIMTDMSPVLEKCIAMATRLSFHCCGAHGLGDGDLSALTALADHQPLDSIAMSGFMLLLSRVRVERPLLEKVRLPP